MSALMSRVKARGDALSERVAVLGEMIASGEGSSAAVELELIRDEMRFLAELARVELLIGIRRRLELPGSVVAGA